MLITNNGDAQMVIGDLTLLPGQTGIVPKAWEPRIRALHGGNRPNDTDGFGVGLGFITETEHAPAKPPAAEPWPSELLEWSDKDAIAWVKKEKNRATLAALLEDLRQRETIDPGFNPRPRVRAAIGERIDDLIAAEPSGKPFDDKPSGWSFGPSLGSPEQDIAQLRRLIATEPRENVRRDMTAMLTSLGASVVTSGAAKLVASK